MNILLIAVLIIVIGSMIWGYWRGFVRLAFSLVSMILVILLVSWGTPYLTEYLKENTTVYETLTRKCAEQLQKTTQQAMEHTIETPASLDEGQIGAIDLPKPWVDAILEKAANTAEESGAYQQAGAYIADWVLKGIAFFAAFFLITIVLRLVVGLLDIVTRIPIIKGFNRFCGGLAGFVQGLILVWLLLFLVAIAYSSQFGQLMIGYIKESSVLTFLYNNNGLLYLLGSVFGG